MSDWSRIHLGTPSDAMAELERCSTGLATLDHQYTQSRAALDAAEDDYAGWEAKGIAALDLPKGVTAKELNARLDEWIGKNKEARQARDELRHTRRTLDLIGRWFRSLEKRASNAQSALRGHDSVERLGGRV